MRNLTTKLVATASLARAAGSAIGCALTSFIGGTLALAAFAATFDPRLALAVIGSALLGFFLLDVVLITRRSRGA